MQFKKKRFSFIKVRLIQSPLLCFFFLFFLQNSFALDTENKEQNNFQRFSALPFLSYSEETKIQYGALLVLFFKKEHDNAKTATLDILAMGTQNKQFRLRTKPDLYFFNDHIHVPSVFQFSNWRGELFERGSKGSFNPIERYDQITLYGKIPVELNFGIPSFLPFRYGVVLEAENRENDFSSNFDITATYKDGTFVGGGYRLVSDFRDNTNWPTKGHYISFEEIFYGYDFKFRTEELDIRAYAPLFFNTSIAVGAYWKQTKGNVPFGYLAGPDGVNRFRGVDPGVWNDTQVLIGQIEFRKTLFYRFAGTIFYEYMESAKYFGALFRNNFHYAFGFGGRLALNKTEKLHARGDISLIDNKHIGLTVYLREAF